MITHGHLTVSAQSNELTRDTQVKPTVQYRQAGIARRESSPYHRTSNKDFSDQVAIGLKLIRTHKLVNEIVLEPVFRTVKEDPQENEFTIDQAYAKGMRGKWSLLGGKIAERFGSGFFVNPSDITNEDRDLFDPFYQNQGRSLFRIGYQSGSWSTSLAFIPRQNKNATEGKPWLNLTGLLWDTDINFQATFNKNEKATIGLSLARFFGEVVELHADTKVQQKARSRERAVERTIFDCEAVNSFETNARNQYGFECLSAENDGTTIDSVVGGRLVFSAKRTFIVEGIQNQSGLTREELENYYHYVAASRDIRSQEADNPTRTLGRQYLLIAYQDEDTLPQTQMTLAVINNLADESRFFNPELKWTMNPLLKFSLSYLGYAGKPDTEFGSHPFSDTVIVGAHASF